MIKNNGTGLENFVCELYKDLGYLDVTRDFRLTKSNGDESVRGQIDITYKHMLIKRYVECKQRSESNVTFDDYAKFETTLKTFNIPTYLGEIITNTYFDDKVKLRAKETKIKLIDKDELLRLCELRNSGLHLSILAFRFIEIIESVGLKSAVEYVITRNLSLDKQIQKYTRI
jgi:hypothetical protein